MGKTIFTKALGDSPKIKVLEFLIEGRELDYSITDIAEGSGISRTTLFRIWEDLIVSKIIMPTRTIGNSKLFRLNMENPAVVQLVKLFDLLVIEPLKNSSSNQAIGVKHHKTAISAVRAASS